MMCYLKTFVSFSGWRSLKSGSIKALCEVSGDSTKINEAFFYNPIYLRYVRTRRIH